MHRRRHDGGGRGCQIRLLPPARRRPSRADPEHHVVSGINRPDVVEAAHGEHVPADVADRRRSVDVLVAGAKRLTNSKDVGQHIVFVVLIVPRSS